MPDFEVNLDKILVRDVNTKLREETFGGLVVSRNNPTMCLNESAVFLFNLCDGKRSVKDIVVAAAEKLETTPDSIASKVITALSWMYNTGILKNSEQ